MAGAIYRNSSSGRNERHDKDDRDLAPKKPLPANIRLAHREEPQPAPHFATGHTLSMSRDPNKPKVEKSDDVAPPRGDSTAKIFAKATKSAEKLAAEAAAEKSATPRAPRRTVAKQNTDSEGARYWQVRLTPSTLLTISILLLVTLGFFFLFGLIVGRGSVPPAQTPVLERLAPHASTSTESPEQILPEENLRFMTNLKSDIPSTAEVGNVSQAVAPKKTVSAPDTTASKDKPENKADTTKYDYVVRAAAFKSENQADDLRARLEGNGIRTRLIREKNQKGTWYHVQILYRGTEQGLEELRNSLKKYAIRDSIIASKTPVV